MNIFFNSIVFCCLFLFFLRHLCRQVEENLKIGIVLPATVSLRTVDKLFSVKIIIVFSTGPLKISHKINPFICNLLFLNYILLMLKGCHNKSYIRIANQILTYSTRINHWLMFLLYIAHVRHPVGSFLSEWNSVTVAHSFKYSSSSTWKSQHNNVLKNVFFKTNQILSFQGQQGQGHTLVNSEVYLLLENQ